MLKIHHNRLAIMHNVPVLLSSISLESSECSERKASFEELPRLDHPGGMYLCVGVVFIIN